MHKQQAPLGLTQVWSIGEQDVLSVREGGLASPPIGGPLLPRCLINKQSLSPQPVLRFLISKLSYSFLIIRKLSSVRCLLCKGTGFALLRF